MEGKNKHNSNKQENNYNEEEVNTIKLNKKTYKTAPNSEIEKKKNKNQENKESNYLIFFSN